MCKATRISFTLCADISVLNNKVN